MARVLRFKDKQGECEGNQEQSRQIDRQQVHREKREQERDRTDDAGRDQAGMRELGIDTDEPDQQQDEEHIRLNDAGEEALACRHLEVDDLWMREHETARPSIEARDHPAIEPNEQILSRVRDEVAELAIERFFFGESLRGGNRGFCQRDIPAAPGRVAAQVGRGVVDDLVLHRLVDRHGRSEVRGGVRLRRDTRVEVVPAHAQIDCEALQLPLILRKRPAIGMNQLEGFRRSIGHRYQVRRIVERVSDGNIAIERSISKL